MNVSPPIKNFKNAANDFDKVIQNLKPTLVSPNTDQVENEKRKLNSRAKDNSSWARKKNLLKRVGTKYASSKYCGGTFRLPKKDFHTKILNLFRDITIKHFITVNMETF